MGSDFIYLDYNATTPLDKRVMEYMLPYFDVRYANPNSPHLFGLTVRELVDEATENMASCIGARAKNIIYTSGATEAVNLALKGLHVGEKKHIITVSTEHSAVLDTCSFLETLGYAVTYLPVDAFGMVELSALEEAITEQTLLVSVMLANNETGVLHPVKRITQIAHKKDTFVLCDATQAVGKIPVDVKELGVDMMAFSAHKFYGPKGIGALYLSDTARKVVTTQLHGGKQQQGMRSGTLNVPAILGMQKALEIANAEMLLETRRIQQLRDLLEEGLLSISDTFISGHTENRLHTTSNIAFLGTQSEQLILNLGSICVSSGSACTSTVTRPSHVLTAMGLSDADGLSALRFSVGRFTTQEEIEKTIDAIKSTVNRLRNGRLF
ncbi:cysteine desulfurase family protein [Sphingobacterium sp.]|uniref:cysteine desulfurase family protein n=1 Tax=Sphingobacterium sp. TaxID=341027 RepID=UPI0028A15BE6|nr:cysteine desulfurase family protein [Sphingobacterium sp.]